MTGKKQDMEWMKLGDRLFDESYDDFEMNACVNQDQPCLARFADEFKASADVLAEQAMQNRIPVDTIIGPVSVLYRHAIELRLKQVFLMGRHLGYLGAVQKLPTHHDLKNLWKIAKGVLQKHFTPENAPEAYPQDDVEAAEVVILEFQSTDPSACGFRYPWDKEYQPQLGSLRLVNIPNLYEVMGRLDSFLKGMGGMLKDTLDWRLSSQQEQS